MIGTLLRLLGGTPRVPADPHADERERVRARIADLRPNETATGPLPDDSHWCGACRRGVSGPWCGLCGRQTRALELGVWNRPPFDRRRRE